MCIRDRCNFAPLPSDDEANTELESGDVVKVQLGAHIDGYPAVLAHTVVVGASAQHPVTGRVADAVRAAQTASDVMIRLMKPGMLNHDIGKKVETAIKEFGVRPVANIQTNQFGKDEIDGKKKITVGDDASSRPDAQKLEENEVYGLSLIHI